MFDISSLLGGDSSTFPEDYRGPVAKITPIRAERQRRTSRIAAAFSRGLVYLGQSLEAFPEHFID